MLIRRYNQRLYRVARAIMRDDDEAEDIMQDAYVRAYEHLGQFKGNASFATWLTRIAVHEALARLRKRKRGASLEDEIGDGDQDERMTANDRTAEQRTFDHELRPLIEAAIDGLPAAFRAVFVLRAVEEMSTTEVATALGIPEDRVKTRLHRARGLLQRAIESAVDVGARDAFVFEKPRCDRIAARVLTAIGRPRSP